MSSSPRLDMSKARALIVDDNAKSLEVMLQILVGFGFREIQKCRSVADARNLVSSQSYDILFLDDEMMSENGIEFTRFIRSKPRLPNFTAPIVIVSGYTPERMVLGARDAGANIVVAKPIAIGTLMARIEWFARGDRAFVMSDTYNGPDRRSKNLPPPEETGDRRAPIEGTDGETPSDQD